MPGALGDFLTKLPANVRYMQVENPYMWERHATIKAFWRLLIQGFAVGEASTLVTVLTALSAGLLGVGLLAVVVRQRKFGSNGRDGMIAATIAVGPLLMPFYFDYDLLLLAVPATLFAGGMLGAMKEWAPAEPSSQSRSGRSPLQTTARWTVRAWITLYAVLLVNPAMGSLTHVNFAVPLLAAVAGMLIVRAWRYNNVVEIPAVAGRASLRRAA
jgi:hypothetical protein